MSDKSFGILLFILCLLHWANWILEYLILDKCQKQHNVYQCKMVAVPVEDGR